MEKDDPDEEKSELENKDETEVEHAVEDKATGLPVSDKGERTQASKENIAEEPARATAKVDKEKSEPKSSSAISFRDRRHRQRKSGGGNSFWIIAAAFIILLLAIIGAWYFMGNQQGAPPESADPQIIQDNTPAQEQKEKIGTQGEESQQDQQAATDQPKEPDIMVDDTQQQSGADRQTAQADNPPVVTITVTSGQTLWGIAGNEYDNPYLWPWIYDTNKPEIENPNIIYTGQSLDIPKRRGSNNELSANDSLQVALGYVETYLWYKENELENAKFYLYAAKQYHNRVFEYTNANIDEADLTFANRAQ